MGSNEDLAMTLQILTLLGGAAAYGVMLPFMLCARLRTGCVRGSRPRAVTNMVVVNLRPFVRAATVLREVDQMLTDQLSHHGASLMLHLAFDAITLVIFWQMADRWRDDDDDDPWSRRKATLRTWISRLTPAGSALPAGI